MLFEGVTTASHLDLPLWGRGTIRRMGDEVKTLWRQYFVGSNLTHRKRSPLPKGEGLVSWQPMQTTIYFTK